MPFLLPLFPQHDLVLPPRSSLSAGPFRQGKLCVCCVCVRGCVSVSADGQGCICDHIVRVCVSVSVRVNESVCMCMWMDWFGRCPTQNNYISPRRLCKVNEMAGSCLLAKYAKRNAGKQGPVISRVGESASEIPFLTGKI